MPTRLIKESICSSDSLSELSWFEQVLFFRLITLCDDYGCYDARIKILKGRAFPMDSVTDKQIADGLHKLVTAGIATLYTVGGKPYLQLDNWASYQNVRAKKRKFPSISDADADYKSQHENTCIHPYTDVYRCSRNPNPNPESESESDDEDDSYARTREVVRQKFRQSLGRQATPAEAQNIAMAAQMYGMDDDLIDRLLSRCAVYGASSPAPYFNALVNECRYYCIHTADEYDKDLAMKTLKNDDARQDALKARKAQYGS